LPSEFLALPREERAFIMASINLKIAHEKKEASRLKKNKKAR
jgi:hypothetical protein